MARLLQCLGLLALTAVLLLSQAELSLGQASFTFSIVQTNSLGNGVWGAVDTFLRPLNRPLPMVTGYNSSDSDNQWAVAPAGSFLLFGTQPDVSVSPDQGTTWLYTSGTTAGNAHMDGRDINPLFPARWAEWLSATPAAATAPRSTASTC